MTRFHYLLPLGALLLAMLPVTGEAQQNVQITYFLNVNFTCNNGKTTPGYSVYVVGGRPEIGNWDPTQAEKLTPSTYPTWTGTVKFTGANPGDVLAWKCIIRNETNPSDVQAWQPDPNNQVTMAFSPVPQSSGSF